MLGASAVSASVGTARSPGVCGKWAGDDCRCRGARRALLSPTCMGPARRCWLILHWQVFRVCGPPCSDFGLRRQVSRLPESPCRRFAASAAGFPSSCSKMPARGDGNSGNPPKIPRTRARRPRNPENPPASSSRRYSVCPCALKPAPPKRNLDASNRRIACARSRCVPGAAPMRGCP